MIKDYECHENLTMLADFYQFTMGNGYFENGLKDKVVTFDMFFRKIPDRGGFAIMAGVEQLIEYMQNIVFTEKDIDYLRSRGQFSEGFLDYLKNYKFECDVWAVPEGTPIFPQEPLIVVKGPAIQAQLMETMILLIINHQSLVATKTNRIVRAAEGRGVTEFGSRRAQGASGATMGARAAYIGGANGTANTLADRDYKIPALGTMAHSWVQMFPTEYEAFKAYAETYPDKCLLLVDTYNSLKQGIPNAIKVFDEVVKPKGFRPLGIRIDSGDIAYTSKKAREMLDAAGYEDCKIMASNSLDETVIADLIAQGAKIDSFGVGERLITSSSEPVFSGVYKLSSVERDGKMIPVIKLSDNVEKITTPGFKQVYRIFDGNDGRPMADLICLHDEKIDFSKPLEIFHPLYTWKRKKVENYTVRPLLVQIFEKGKLVYDMPKLENIRQFCKREIDNLWEEVKRFKNPHEYFVDLSEKLWNEKAALLKRNS